MEKGKFYLFASPWFWTCVGRYVRHLNFQDIEIADAIYFHADGGRFYRAERVGDHRSAKGNDLPRPGRAHDYLVGRHEDSLAGSDPLGKREE